MERLQRDHEAAQGTVIGNVSNVGVGILGQLRVARIWLRALPILAAMSSSPSR